MHISWDVLRLLKWIQRSQRSLFMTWSPFDASPLTKPLMILVSRAHRPATIELLSLNLSFSCILQVEVEIRISEDGLTCLPWGHYY